MPAAGGSRRPRDVLGIIQRERVEIIRREREQLTKIVAADACSAARRAQERLIRARRKVVVEAIERFELKVDAELDPHMPFVITVDELPHFGTCDADLSVTQRADLMALAAGLSQGFGDVGVFEDQDAGVSITVIGGFDERRIARAGRCDAVTNPALAQARAKVALEDIVSHLRATAVKSHGKRAGRIVKGMTTRSYPVGLSAEDLAEDCGGKTGRDRRRCLRRQRRAKVFVGGPFFTIDDLQPPPGCRDTAESTAAAKR